MDGTKPQLYFSEVGGAFTGCYQRGNTKCSPKVAAHFEQFDHNENSLCIFILFVFVSRRNGKNWFYNVGARSKTTCINGGSKRQKQNKYFSKTCYVVCTCISTHYTTNHRKQNTQGSYSAVNTEQGQEAAEDTGRGTQSHLPALGSWSRSNCCQLIQSQINLHKSVLHYVRFLPHINTKLWAQICQAFVCGSLFVCRNSLEDGFLKACFSINPTCHPRQNRSNLLILQIFLLISISALC